MTIPSKGRQTEADRLYLQIAQAERANSDDPKAAYVLQSGVGAVIVGKNGIVARSANVVPPSLQNAATPIEITDRERYHLIEHAERAAIFKALLDGVSIKGATLYCTRFPCSDCARAIVWSGISRLVVSSGFGGEERWLEAQRAALEVLRRAGVTVRVMKLDVEPVADSQQR